MPNLRFHLFAEPHVSTAIWLTQLRWVAVAGQLLVIGFVWLALRIPLPIVPLLVLVSVTALSNAALWWWTLHLRKRQPADTNVQNAATPAERLDDSIGNRTLGVLLIVDVFTLTGLLYFSGGAANPFIIFYFANIAIAGMILSRFWAALISTVSILGTVCLLNFATPISVFAGAPLAHDAPWGVTKLAFLSAFATCCGVVTYFVSMLAIELRQRDRQLSIAEKDRERAQRLEALATLAAGAGHELASPLSTIAVVAGELSRSLEKHDLPDSIRRDVGLIREELQRCREILHRMKSGAGEAAAERLHPIKLREILDETITAMREPNRVIVEMDDTVAERTAMLPKQALSQALRNLFQNGLDASGPRDTVIVVSTIEASGHGNVEWQLSITDSGSGMSEEVRRRIGEPFFTTKEVGQGMGLGVFLTRNVINGLGGELKFSPAPTGGTICRVRVPVRC